MNIGITGLGMITSVGRDAATSCASIRAGLTRPHQIHHHEMVDPETLEPVPLIGHPLRGFAEGFNMVGLWIRLAKHCLGDLMKGGDLPGPSETGFWGETAMVAATPYIDDDRFMSSGNEKPDVITESFLLPLLGNLGLPIPPENAYPVCRAHAAVPTAVALADKLTSTSAVKRVIILAVDSYLDSFSLEWLACHERLKSDENPTGLMPGEAGACFLVEDMVAARKRGAKIQAVVTGVGMAKEANDFFSGMSNRGVSLSKAIQQALQADGATASFSGDLISDHNGEEWRAVELAGARLLLDTQLNRDASLILPAACIGAVGAASGAVAVGVAVRAFMRNYASSDRVLVLCSSDHGDVGAILLRNAA